MYAIIVYALGITAVSVLMIVHPRLWVRLAVGYCRQPYMHPIEIAICVGFGAAFLAFGGDARAPLLLRGFGALLVTVGIGLMLTPPRLHRDLGIRTIERMARWFRPLGFGSLAFGALLLYAAW